jgi:hypothetical protein
MNPYNQQENDTNINQNAISSEHYVFWMNDITVLYKDQNYTKFFPTPEMSRIEQLNAITRFFIYLLIILILFTNNSDFLYIPFIGLIAIIILYNVFDADEDGKRAELLRMKRNQNKELMADIGMSDLNYRTYQFDADGEIITVDIDKNESQDYADNSSNNSIDSSEYEIETGFYDSAGKIQFGKMNDATTSLKKYEKNKKNDIKYTLNEMRSYENAKCRKPTIDNPFMNPSVDEFNSDIPVACNADDENIKKDMELKFNADLYRDIEDVFDRKNSQRQFYTIAHNIPNDQEGFARWCYKFPKTCKTDQDRCLKYEDLRTTYY